MNMFDLGGMLLRVGRAITPPDTRLVHSDARGKQQWRVGDFYKQSAQESGSNTFHRNLALTGGVPSALPSSAAVAAAAVTAQIQVS